MKTKQGIRDVNYYFLNVLHQSYSQAWAHPHRTLLEAATAGSCLTLDETHA